MLKDAVVFSGFSVNDLAAAKNFYGSTLGLEIEEMPGMGLTLKLPGGGQVFVYNKDNHEPATFTIMNFQVPNIDDAVDALGAQNVEMERYPDMHQDEKGIARGLSANMGPDIAWFTDPAGNILAVLQSA